jgi:hypothetical protein
MTHELVLIKCRAPARLTDYFSILRWGIRLLASTGELRHSDEPRRQYKIWIFKHELERVDELAGYLKVSRNAIILSSLLWATDCNFGPTRRGADAISKAGKLTELSLPAEI